MSFPDKKLILYDLDLFDHLYKGSNDSIYKSNGLNLIITKATLDGVDWIKLKSDSLLSVDSINIQFEDIRLVERILDSLNADSQGLLKALDIGKLVVNIPSIFLGKGISYRNPLIETDFIKSEIYNVSGKLDSLKYERFEGQVNKIASGILDKVHQFKCSRISLNEETVHLENPGIYSIFSKKSFANNPPGKISFVNFSVPEISLGFNILKNTLKSRIISIPNLTLTNSSLYVFTNSNLPKDASYIPIVSEFILNLKSPIIIKTIEVKNGQIDFEMQAKDREDTGSLSFENIFGTFKNVTNIKSKINQDKWLDVKLKSQFLGESPLQLNVQFDLSSDQYPYNYQGSLKELELPKVNRVMADLAAQRFKEGYLDYMYFDVKASNFSSHGTLECYYKNLKVRHVKERSTGNPDPIRWIVNRLVIRQNNIQDRDPKSGKIDKNRELDKSMYFQMWESILNGLTDILLPL